MNEVQKAIIRSSEKWREKITLEDFDNLTTNFFYADNWYEIPNLACNDVEEEFIYPEEVQE